MAERKKIGELLVEGGYLEPDQLRSALSYQRQWGGRLGANVVKLGFLDDQQLVAFLSNRLQIPAVNLRLLRIPEDVIALISGEVAKKYGMIPLQRSPDKKKIIVAMSDPTNLGAVDEVQFLVNARIIPTVASDTIVEQALRHYYDGVATLKFLPNSVWSTEVDLLTAPSELPAKKAPPVSRDADVETTDDSGDGGDDGDVVIEAAGDDDDDVVMSDASDDGGDMVTGEVEDDDDDLGMLVFSGGKERSIPLAEQKKKAERPKQAPSMPAGHDPHTTINPAYQQAQAQVKGKEEAPKRTGAPSNEELVMALVKLLMDKGLITREELLARLNGK